ncbi:unnamed protein product [Rotaria sp. Silwood1]|nr:unnamed protein product [Rotaria sp. Silwood1]CAF4655782.1 unnamed protein product [Rotaria sp. Silwood1]
MSFSRKDDKVILIDGGLGTTLYEYGLATLDDPLWSGKALVTELEQLAKAHRAFVQAKCDFISTATYQVSVENLMTHHHLSNEQAEEIIYNAVKIARNVIDEEKAKCYVAASIGPYGATLNDGSEFNGWYTDSMTIEQFKDWHRPRLAILARAEPDLIAFETIPSQKEAEALVELLKEFPNDSKRTAHGEPIEEAAASVCLKSPDQIIAVGVNCVHPDTVVPLIKQMNKIDRDFIAYPNAGVTWDAEKQVFNSQGQSIAPFIPSYIDAGLKYRQSTLPTFGHVSEFDYKRDAKYLSKILKQCITAHTLDLDAILHFLSSYTCEQRIILVRDLEFEYDYKLIDMVLERPESPMRSCTLAMLIEPVELYVRDFHDLLTYKQMKKIDYDISRKLVEILLPLNNEDIHKFKETYENLFESSVKDDIDIVQGVENLITNLLKQLLEGKRYEESGHSATVAKNIAKKLYDAGEGTPGIDYDTFIRIFTHDAFSQLSAIFDVYEDKYGRPIQDAIEHEFQEKIEIECFQDMVEYVRSPSSYHAKILRQALDKTPIDYVTLIRTIIGHEDKDLDEICLEYSKIYDETLDQTVRNHIDIQEIKRLFTLIITHGRDVPPTEYDPVGFDQFHTNVPTSPGAVSTSSSMGSANGMRRNRSQEAFDKICNVFKITRPH